MSVPTGTRSLGTQSSEVVVTGSGVVCSIGSDVAAFRDALCAGRAGFIEQDGERAAILESFVLADAMADVPADLRSKALRTARRAPRPVQVALAVALQAWVTGGLPGVPIAPERIGLVVAGSNLTDSYADTLAGRFAASPAHLTPRFALHMLDTDHVGVLSEVLGLRGEGFTVGGASASGNIGIINASRLIECGAVDACLVVGALTELSAMARQGLLNLGALSADGRGSPFDSSHHGFVPGEGAAGLLLERRTNAVRRGAEVLAEIAGFASGLDGNSLADPSHDGEVAVMRRAIESAGLDPAEIDYVNTHGTGAPLGDRTELAAIGEVFAERPGPWVNSTKSMTGHCLAAAGVVEAVACLVQLRGGFVHPNVGLEQPTDPATRLNGAHSRTAELRYALSNSFGFGGFSSCLVLAGAGRGTREEG